MDPHGVPSARLVTRRRFVLDLGTATLGIAVVGLAACTAEGADSTSSTVRTPTSAGSTTATPGTTQPSDASTTTTGSTTTGASWERVDLGFVSAYVLVRNGEAAVIDTGTAGSEEAIERVLEDIGLGWGDVGHILATHLHPDHVGSMRAVMDAAPSATAYAGAADIPSIDASRPLVAVDDGSTVFGCDVIATPGHTAGHVCLLEPSAGILLAGDALTGSDAGVGGPNPQFTADLAAAEASVLKLATFTFETVLFGHGEPVLAGGSQQVAALAGSG